MGGVENNNGLAPAVAVPVARCWTRRRMAMVAAVALCGAALSALFAWLLWERERRVIEVQFQIDADKRIEAMVQAAGERLTLLVELQAFYAGSQLVERTEFQTFTKPLLQERPGIAALGWAPQITLAELPDLRRAAAAAGLTEFDVLQRGTEDKLIPVKQRPDYCPIYYVEPMDNKQARLGFDLLSHRPCRDAVQRAMVSRRPAVALCYAAEADSKHKPMLFIAAPADNNDFAAINPQAAQQRTNGVVFGAFFLDAIIASSLDSFTPLGIDIFLYAEDAGGDSPIYTRLSALHAAGDAAEAASSAASSLCVERNVSFADAQVRIECRAMPCYINRQRTFGPWAVLLTGLAFTTLMAGHVVLLIGRAAKVAQLVTLRTAELEGERRLLRVLLDLQERDRKLVAYEIHDGLAQQLTAATYKLQAAEAVGGRDPAMAAKHTLEAGELLGQAMAETRRLIGGLRPPLLDQSGIVAAIEGLIEEVRRDGGPEIEFVHEMEAERLPPPLETAVFRVIQESLTNACRHSGSPRVRVELEQHADHVHVAVQDWGAGFDQALVGGNHFGLRGIRERARLMGGAAAIRSLIGQGTRIHVEFPLRPLSENHFDD